MTHRGHSSVRGSGGSQLNSLASQTVGIGLAYAPLAHTEIALAWSEAWNDFELAAK